MKFNYELAKTRWQLCKDYYSGLYADMTEDWNFVHGVGQWDEAGGEQRRKEGRPCLVLNQLQPYVLQVANDIRQSRLAIRVSPVDSKADVDTAEVLAGIIRNIEVSSGAQDSYITASLNSIGGGLGWIRLYTDYSGEDSFDQEIYIDRVLDFTSVYLDPAFKKKDGSDSEYAFIRVDYTKEEFERKFPDSEISSFDGQATDDNTVCVVEYFERCYDPSKLYKIELVGGIEQVIDQDQKDILDEDGTVEYTVIENRNVQKAYVKRYVLGGDENPLEENEFPSKYIPIIPVIGNEVFINGKREFHSLIKQGKDAQRAYNYWNSAAAEFIALQPKAPWIGPAGSFKSYFNKWTNSNRMNYAFLEYDPVYDQNGQRLEPPNRQPPIQGSPGLMQQALSARDDIRLAIGMPQSNMGEVAGEVSGVAIRNRQIEGDNATFHFVDNLCTAISHVGRICVDIIPKLYAKRKIARILGEGDKEKNIPINQPFIKENGNIRAKTMADQKYDGIYDLSVGKYDVVCDVGASYSSKRQETADKLVELIKVKPELLTIAGDILFEALDLPMAKEISKRAKAMMDPALLAEDPLAEKLKQSALALNQMQEQLAKYDAALQDKRANEDAQTNIKLKELQIKAKEAQADVDYKYAQIEKMRAETSGFNLEMISTLGNAVNGLAEQVNDINSAVNIMLDSQQDQETSEPEENSVAMSGKDENE